ncbi:MAG: hypothetical protein U0271_14440 [Polyangiaceae bacterium]
MAHETTIAVYDHGRPATASEFADRIYRLLGRASVVEPRWETWSYSSQNGRQEPIRSLDDANTAVRDASGEWQVGAAGSKPRVAYTPSLFVGREAAPVVRVDCRAGMERTAVPAWTPNLVEITVRGALELATVAVLMRTLVEIFEPDWGHVRLDGSPTPPRAIFSDGAPVIGWVTYLSAAYPKLPALPPPARAYPVQRGTVLTASEKAEDSAAAIAPLRRALAGAGVLLPAVAMRTSVLTPA